MSIEIIQKDSTFEVGYVHIGYGEHARQIPSIGMKHPKGRSLKGVAFNTKESLDKAIKFLKQARTAWVDPK